MKVVHALIGPFLTLLVIGAALGCIELLLRHKLYDTSIGDGNAPGMAEFYKKHYQGNSNGWRDVNYEQTKPAETIRILVLGDSFTFGGGIKNVADTWPKVLEHKLREHFPDRSIEVLNSARRGATTTEIADTLHTKGLGFDPDIIIYAVNMNDIETNADKKEASEKAQQATSIFGKSLLHHSYLTYSLAQLMRGFDSDGRNSTYLQRLYASPENQRLQKAAFEDIKESYGSHPLIIGILPNAPENGHMPLEHEYMQLKETLESIEIQPVDMQKGLPSTTQAEYRVSFFDYHPNEKIHRFFAETFYNATLPFLESIYGASS